jgi:hypothetical protein
MTDAKEPSRMEQKLAETDRIGIIGLRNDLLAGGAFPPMVEHVIELLTSRTLTIYFFAEQCRKKETEVATLTRERDEARKERDHYMIVGLWRLDRIYAVEAQLAAARVCKWREDDPDFGTWRTGCGHLWSFNAGGPEENDAKFCQYCGGALTAALTQEDA